MLKTKFDDGVHKKVNAEIDWQSHLRIISEEVDEMFRMINGDVGNWETLN